MPRNLPWMSKGSVSVQSSKATKASIARTKRQLLINPLDDAVDSPSPKKISTSKTRGPRLSSSPAPRLEPPTETFMEEGIEFDDGYRMVEDELLDTAKLFTQHLHAAEYQRMKKAAKSHNAEMINSISRPVVLRMPEAVRRKTESVTRAKKQANLLASVLGKRDQEIDSDDSEGVPSPWLGTALHNLMDSPRKKAASLMKISNENTGTRAAAGLPRSCKRVSPDLPPILAGKHNGRGAIPSVAASTSSVDGVSFSDGDDDLDAPRPKEKASRSQAALHIKTRDAGERKPFTTTENMAKPSKEERVFIDSNRISSVDNNAVDASKTEHKDRMARIRDKAKMRKIRAEKETRRKALDDIPTFL